LSPTLCHNKSRGPLQAWVTTRTPPPRGNNLKPRIHNLKLQGSVTMPSLVSSNQ
jgi:hypothetical protein